MLDSSLFNPKGPKGSEIGPSQIAEERGALWRDPSRRAELHGEESLVEISLREMSASWRVSPRREALRKDKAFVEKALAERPSPGRESLRGENFRREF